MHMLFKLKSAITSTLHFFHFWSFLCIMESRDSPNVMSSNLEGEGPKDGVFGGNGETPMFAQDSDTVSASPLSRWPGSAMNSH